MSFIRRSVRINNENEMPVNPGTSRPGKRHIVQDAQDAGNAVKRLRVEKSQTLPTIGEPRRTALGDVTNRRSGLGDATNRMNVKKASVNTMSAAVANAGALAKKKNLASKRSLSNVNCGSRKLNTENAGKRNLGNINIGSRLASSATGTISSLSTRSSSSVTSRINRLASNTDPVITSLGVLGVAEKRPPMINVIPLTPEEVKHDIDTEDKNDSATCWQYAEDITKFYLETEKKHKSGSSYMARQSDINSKMRAILVDWLVDVHYKYGLLPQTLHIAVLLIDYFLEKSFSIGRQRLQLVGVTAMFIASKYEEIFPPEAEDFVKITDNAYTREEVFQMEAKMLATIGFRVTFPTAFQFMKRFIKASRTCDDRVEHFAHYIIDRTLQEYKMMKYLPSTIAASAVYVARTQMRDTPAWSSTLEYHSSYSEHSLGPCIDDVKEMLWNAHNGVGKLAKLTAARRKFSKERFLSVASQPLAFLKSA